jgi:uncharacterized membrane protein
MSPTAHLWAIGYDDMEGADQLREEIARLGRECGKVGTYLMLLDIAVVVCHPDGSFTFDREPFPDLAHTLSFTALGLLAALPALAPLAGDCIGEDFIHEVKGLMKSGSSVLFVLDKAGDMEVILNSIRGLGGTVLKTNVDLEHAELIQSTLAGSADRTESV